MRTRTTAGALGVVFLLATAVPVDAGAAVTTIQYREQGVTVNFTNIPGWYTDEDLPVPPGDYYFATISAGIGEASGLDYAGSSKDAAWFSYAEWEVTRRGEWLLIADWGGYSPEGAAGLQIGPSASRANLKTSMPVGYCAESAPEDAGGECLEYVWMGMVSLDLTWTPTSGLISGRSTEAYGVPGEWQYVHRNTGHYREAYVTGSLTLPGSASETYSSPLADIYLRATGEMELSVTRGE